MVHARRRRGRGDARARVARPALPGRGRREKKGAGGREEAPELRVAGRPPGAPVPILMPCGSGRSCGTSRSFSRLRSRSSSSAAPEAPAGRRVPRDGRRDRPPRLGLGARGEPRRVDRRVRRRADPPLRRPRVSAAPPQGARKDVPRRRNAPDGPDDRRGLRPGARSGGARRIRRSSSASSSPCRRPRSSFRSSSSATSSRRLTGGASSRSPSSRTSRSSRSSSSSPPSSPEAGREPAAVAGRVVLAIAGVASPRRGRAPRGPAPPRRRRADGEPRDVHGRRRRPRPR